MLKGYCQFSSKNGWYNKYSLKCSVMATSMSGTPIWCSNSSFHGLLVLSCHRLLDDNAHLLVSGRAPLPILPQKCPFWVESPSCSWQRPEQDCSCRLVLMPGKPPGHLQKVTPILTSYWLLPPPGVHSMAGKFMQNLL